MMLGDVTPYLEKPGEVLAIDALKDGIRFAIKNGSYMEALEMLQLSRRMLLNLEQELDLRKACLSTVILHLACGDGDKAEQSMAELATEVPCFSGTEDYECASNILAAYADKDEDALKVCKKSDRVLTLDPSMVRMFAGLHVDGAEIDGSFSTRGALDLNEVSTSGGGGRKPAAVADLNDSPKHTGAAAQPVADDDDTDLC